MERDRATLSLRQTTTELEKTRTTLSLITAEKQSLDKDKNALDKELKKQLSLMLKIKDAKTLAQLIEDNQKLKNELDLLSDQKMQNESLKENIHSQIRLQKCLESKVATLKHELETHGINLLDTESQDILIASDPILESRVTALEAALEQSRKDGQSKVAESVLLKAELERLHLDLDQKNQDAQAKSTASWWKPSAAPAPAPTVAPKANVSASHIAQNPVKPSEPSIHHSNSTTFIEEDHAIAANITISTSNSTIDSSAQPTSATSAIPPTTSKLSSWFKSTALPATAETDEKKLLRDKISTLEGQVATMKAQIDGGLQRDFDVLKGQLEESIQKNAQNQVQYSELNNVIISMRREAELSATNALKSAEELQKVNSDRSDHLIQLEAANALVAKLKLEQEQSTKISKSKNSESNGIDNETQLSLEREIKSLSDKLNENKTEKEFNDLQTNYQKVCLDLKSLQAGYQQLQSKFREMGDSVHTSEGVQVPYGNQDTALIEKIDILNGEISGLVLAREEAQKQHAQELNAQQAHVAESIKKATDLERAHKDLEAKHAQLTMSSKRLDEIPNLEKNLHGCRKELDTYRTQLSASKERSDALLSSLQEQLNAVLLDKAGAERKLRVEIEDRMKKEKEKDKSELEIRLKKEFSEANEKLKKEKAVLEEGMLKERTEADAKAKKAALEVDEKIKRWVADLDKAKKDMDVLKVQKQDEVSKLQSKVKNLETAEQAGKAEQKKIIDQLNIQIKELSVKLETQMADQSFKIDLDKSKEELEAVHSKFSIQSQELEVIQSQYSRTTKVLSEREEINKKLTKKNDELQQSETALKKLLARYDKEKLEEKDVNAGLMKQLESIQAQLDTMQLASDAKISDEKSHVSLLEKQIADLNLSTHELTSQLELAEQHSKNTERKNTQIVQAINSDKRSAKAAGKGT